jgi:hypothetical protein
MNWLKKAPTGLIIAVVVTVGVMTVAYLGGYVYLLAMDKDVAEYRALLNTTMNFVMLLLGGTAAVGSVAAARSASNAEDNTNGTLERRDETIADQGSTIATLRRDAADREGRA